MKLRAVGAHSRRKDSLLWAGLSDRIKTVPTSAVCRNPTGEISTKGDCMYSDHQIFSEPNNHSSITIMREQVVLTLEIGDVAHSFVMDEHEVKELYCGMQRALSFIKKGDS